MSDEGQKILDTLEDMRGELKDLANTVDELDDVVRGDPGRRLSGLLEDMDLVQEFIVKWDRREYMIRGVVVLLSSSILLSCVSLIVQLFLQ
jgi:hypothetical protein